MILTTFKMMIPAKNKREALKIIRSVALKIRDESDCLNCCISRDVENSNVIIYQEYWKSEEGLNHHVRSSDYRNLLLVMEMACTKPEVRFDTISCSTGIETIERILRTIRTEEKY